jgi:hypothetical protein
MIKNPPTNGHTADELWFVGDGGAHRQGARCSWAIFASHYRWPYVARFGERWFLAQGMYPDRQVVEFPSLEAALLAWRIMK